MSRKKIIIGTVILLSTLFIAYCIFAFYVAQALTARSSPHLEIQPEVIGTDYQNISFKDNSGLNLQGWLFKGTTDKLVIMVTGINNNRVNTSYYAAMIAKDLLAQGYGVLMYDHQATGLSEGSRVSYGTREGEGVLAAVAFSKTQGFAPGKTAILADSLGAISTLNVIDRLGGVGAIIADSVATDMTTPVSGVLTREKGVPGIVLPAVYWLDKIVYHVDFSQVSPLRRLSSVPERKILYLHGQKDLTIPVSNAQKLLLASNRGSKLVVFPKGEHVETYKTDPDLYRSEVFTFLTQELDL